MCLASWHGTVTLRRNGTTASEVTVQQLSGGWRLYAGCMGTVFWIAYRLIPRMSAEVALHWTDILLSQCGILILMGVIVGS